MKFKNVKINRFLVVVLLIALTNQLSSTQTAEPSNSNNKNGTTQQSNQQAHQNNINSKSEELTLHNPKLIQIYPNQNKIISISNKQLKKYLNDQNRQKLIQQFVLQLKNIVRKATILVTLLKKDSEIRHTQNIKQYKNQKQQQTFSLKFLSQIDPDQIDQILLSISSNVFSVVKLTLMNRLISDNIDAKQLTQRDFEFPICLPQSYNAQQDNYKQLLKYVYFRPDLHKTKLIITRIKGHPKVFLYNCQVDKIDFCKDEIQKQHIEGLLMFQKQLQIQIQKQQKCEDCVIILAFKNMGVQTQVTIKNNDSHSLVLAKGIPIMKQMNQNHTLSVQSYYQLNKDYLTRDLFIDISINYGDSKDFHIQWIKLEPLVKQDPDKSILLEQKDFKIRYKPNMIRISKIQHLDFQKLQRNTPQHKQKLFKISLRISFKNKVIFSIVDQNLNPRQQAALILKDGQIFHASMIQNPIISSFHPFFYFRIKLNTISTLTVTTKCNQINDVKIQFADKNKQKLFVHPKVSIQTIENNLDQCSQLIHLNPSQLINDKDHSNQVLFKLQGTYGSISLLYSSYDMIMLDKSYSYHSQIRHRQNLHFYVRNIKDSAIIKIQKCSNCDLSVKISQQQLVDLKTKRSSQIIHKQIQSISHEFVYKMKQHQGLFLSLATNNFAHFVVTVQQTSNQISQQLKDQNNLLLNNKISFSLQDDHKLSLKFYPPKFQSSNKDNIQAQVPIYSLIEGSKSAQVARQTYCPKFIFNQKKKTLDIEITKIPPSQIKILNDQGQLSYNMSLKHHDFFGIRVQEGNKIFAYQVVNIQNMKQYSENRWSIFNVLLFLTFTLFMSFVCFMGLKRKRIVKRGGQIIVENTDDEEQSMTSLN